MLVAERGSHLSGLEVEIGLAFCIRHGGTARCNENWTALKSAHVARFLSGNHESLDDLAHLRSIHGSTPILRRWLERDASRSRGAAYSTSAAHCGSPPTVQAQQCSSSDPLGNACETRPKTSRLSSAIGA